MWSDPIYFQQTKNKKWLNKFFIMQKLVLLTLMLLFLQFGCDQYHQGPVKRSWGRMKGLEQLVGNMNDTTYSRTLSLKPRLNALGRPTSLAQFRQKYIWIEDVASWCPTCAKQTPQTQKAKKGYEREVAFITIITSKGQSYNDIPTVDTAKEWTNRYNLNPAHVLVAENLWAKTIPEHRLISPEGHTLFVHVGFLTADQIGEVIDYYKPEWDRWKKTNEPASWMKFL